MTSPFSAWAGDSGGESQVNQARMKALGRRRKSHKKASLEVVKEADKEGEEGAATHDTTTPGGFNRNWIYLYHHTIDKQLI